VFASLSANGQSLEEHLGSPESIDELADRAPDGEIDLSAGVHKIHVPRQLEAPAREHGGHVSRAVLARVHDQAQRQAIRPRAGEQAGSEISDRGSAAQRWEQRSAWGSRSNGHSYNGHQPVAEQLPDDPAFKAYFALLVKRHGEERARSILVPKRHNTAFYPNMTLQALNQHVRVIVPVAVDRTSPCLSDHVQRRARRDEPRLRAPPQSHPLGRVADQTDDLECFRRCQTGLSARGSEWVWLPAASRPTARTRAGRLRQPGHRRIQQARRNTPLGCAYERGRVRS